MHWFVITWITFRGRRTPYDSKCNNVFCALLCFEYNPFGIDLNPHCGVRPPLPDRSSIRYLCIVLRSVMWEDLDVGLKRCSALPGCCSISFFSWYNAHSRFPWRPTQIECLYIGWVPGAWIRPIATTVEDIVWRLLSTCVDVNMPWNMMPYFKKCDFVWYYQKLFWLEWFLTFLYYISQTISHTDWILPTFHHRYAIPLLLHHKNSMSKLVGRQQGEDASSPSKIRSSSWPLFQQRGSLVFYEGGFGWLIRDLHEGGFHWLVCDLHRGGFRWHSWFNICN